MRDVLSVAASPAPSPAPARAISPPLADWCQPYSGYHLFYPSRRQSSAAFGLVVEALRWRSQKV